MVRVRIYNKDRKAVLTVKGKQVLENGVGTSTEEEEDLDPVWPGVSYRAERTFGTRFAPGEEIGEKSTTSRI